MLATLTDISKFYNGNQILKNISLTIEDNDRIGLIGTNGCGKTTLLRILTGKEYPDRETEEEGIISFSSNVSVGYLEQAGFHNNDNTIIAEMKTVFSKLYEVQERLHYLEMELSENSSNEANEEYSQLSSYFELNDGYNIDVKIKTVLNGMGFDETMFKRKISSFSGGEQTRLSICRLLLLEPNLLILDEPTNHLDFKTIIWLEGYLKGYKGALLIVSHDRYFLDALVTSVCEIENGNLRRYKGNYTSFVKLKDEYTSRAQKEYDKQQKEIAKLEDYVARNKVRASTAKSAQSRVKTLEKMDRLEKVPELPKNAKISFTYSVIPPFDILNVKNIDITVGNDDKKKVLAENVSFEVKRSEKIAIIGDNGTGKSTLLKVLMGNLPHSGSVNWASNVKISYFEQENTILNMNNTVFDEIHSKYPILSDFEIRSLLGSVRLTGENVFKNIGVISGGERAKVRFAVMMLEKGNVMILDEPTNHLDLPTKEVLENALCSFDGTIIFVSHDRYLLNKIATKIIEISDNAVQMYRGGFDDYMRVKQMTEASDNTKEKPKSLTDTKQSNDKKAAKVYRTKAQRSEDAQRRNYIKQLECEIDDMQIQLDILQEEITHEEIFSDFKLMTEKCLEIDNIKKDMDKKFEQIIELSE